ncbi:GlsB/YeaQ/YmgE family stress response membrane protein [Bdellovibrionota bacterium FG-1]
MGILGWILFGFVVGLIARVITPGRDPLGLIGTIVLGVMGALLAGWLGQVMGFYGPNNGAGIISATLGAIGILSLYQIAMYRRQRRQKPPIAHDRAA